MNVVMPKLPGAKEYMVAKVLVSQGDTVEAGQELFSVETNKKAVVIRSRADGVVVRVFAKEGDSYAPGDVLATLEPAVEDHEEAAPATEPVETAPATPASEGPADLLVIGGGTGGYVAALYAAKHGMRVTLIERDLLGGTCLNRGCIPTKSLIASAAVNRTVQHAAQWGIEVDGSARPLMDRIVERKDAIVGQLRDGLTGLMESNGITVIHGSARFEDNETVVVSSEEQLRLRFRDCIIATGSTIRLLSMPGAELPEVIGTDEALESTELPASIVVVGGGVTGMEFAFLYSNLGVRVTLIARRARLLHTFGEEASKALLRSAQERGIEVELRADVKEFAKDDQGFIVTSFEQDGVVRRVSSEQVLVAGGRIPETRGLGLENTDVAVNPTSKCISVDKHMRTTVEHVYAIGDVNGLAMLAHAASYQGRVAVDNILGMPAAFDETLVASVAYTDPEVAKVGIGTDEAAAEGRTVGTFSFAHNGKALADGEPAGGVTLVADSDGRICGAEVIGAHASDLIGYVAVALSSQMTAGDLRRAVFAHPTRSEALQEAAFDLTFGALHE